MQEENTTELTTYVQYLRWLSSGMFHRVVWQILTDASEELTAFNLALTLEAVSTSETFLNLHQTTW
jgi:hypothetical protein